MPKTPLGERMAFKRPSVQFCPAPPSNSRTYGNNRKSFFFFKLIYAEFMPDFKMKQQERMRAFRNPRQKTASENF